RLGAHFEFLHDLVRLRVDNGEFARIAIRRIRERAVTRQRRVDDAFNLRQIPLWIARGDATNVPDREAFEHATAVRVEDGDFAGAKTRYVHLRAIRQDAAAVRL